MRSRPPSTSSKSASESSSFPSDPVGPSLKHSPSVRLASKLLTKRLRNGKFALNFEFSNFGVCRSLNLALYLYSSEVGVGGDAGGPRGTGCESGLVRLLADLGVAKTPHFAAVHPDRQPVLRGAVQDVEVRARLPGALRLERGSSALW